MPDGVTITETAVINPTIVLATTTSAITKGMEIETISTMGISEMITRGTMTRNVTAAENQPMDGEEEYDKRIAQLGARHATIAE